MFQVAVEVVGHVLHGKTIQGFQQGVELIFQLAQPTAVHGGKDRYGAVGEGGVGCGDVLVELEINKQGTGQQVAGFQAGAQAVIHHLADFTFPRGQCNRGLMGDPLWFQTDQYRNRAVGHGVGAFGAKGPGDLLHRADTDAAVFDGGPGLQAAHAAFNQQHIIQCLGVECPPGAFLVVMQHELVVVFHGCARAHVGVRYGEGNATAKQGFQ